jgi:hypothetical protein
LIAAAARGRASPPAACPTPPLLTSPAAAWDPRDSDDPLASLAGLLRSYLRAGRSHPRQGGTLLFAEMRKGNIVAAVACGPGEESPIYLGGSPASPRGTPLEHLLERGAELERIVRAAARSVEGEPALVVVEGAAGLGKTALLLEARRRLRQAPTTVLAGRPGEQEASFAYGVLRQLLGPLLAAVSP